jgi:hypothetical protein
MSDEKETFQTGANGDNRAIVARRLLRFLCFLLFNGSFVFFLIFLPVLRGFAPLREALVLTYLWMMRGQNNNLSWTRVIQNRKPKIDCALCRGPNHCFQEL